MTPPERSAGEQPTFSVAPRPHRRRGESGPTEAAADEKPTATTTTGVWDAIADGLRDPTEPWHALAAWAEASTGLGRQTLFSAAAIVLAAYLARSGPGSVALGNVVAWLHPAYAFAAYMVAVPAVAAPADRDRGRGWSWWPAYAVTLVAVPVAEWQVGHALRLIVPGYELARCAFFVWCYTPGAVTKTRGLLLAIAARARYVRNVLLSFLKTKKSVPRNPKGEHLKMFEFESNSEKLKRLRSLFVCFVSKYNRLKMKNTEIAKNLELSIIENNRFKSATQCLIKDTVELTGYMVDGCSEGNDHFFFQLLREVIEYKTKTEEIFNELGKAEEQLAMSQETRKGLTKRVNTLMLEDQYRVEKNFRVACECILVELSISKIVKNYLREALSTKINEIELIKRSAVADIDQLHTKVIMLKDKEVR